ncbi:MAG: hypothetical protein MUP70_06490, partial [Candidatus Aminicenantes bacterium]|nr:hypothetical protein [Candidatus Aminicenantes bacterium]
LAIAGIIMFNGGSLVFRSVGGLMDRVDPELSRDLVAQLGEAIENGPPGLKARLTYVAVEPDECRQTFDLAMPGREMTCYMTGTLIKQK